QSFLLALECTLLSLFFFERLHLLQSVVLVRFLLVVSIGDLLLFVLLQRFLLPVHLRRRRVLHLQVRSVLGGGIVHLLLLLISFFLLLFVLLLLFFRFLLFLLLL
ncbi:hypothetical protein PFISCL1PPCAC_14306, partial [Pristionchus fissidentatus]